MKQTFTRMTRLLRPRVCCCCVLPSDRNSRSSRIPSPASQPLTLDLSHTQNLSYITFSTFLARLCSRHTHTQTRKHTHTHAHTYVYACVCVCVLWAHTDTHTHTHATHTKFPTQPRCTKWAEHLSANHNGERQKHQTVFEMGRLLQFDFFYVLIFLVLTIFKKHKWKNEFFPDQFKASHQMETEEAFPNITCDKCIPFAALKWQNRSFLPVTD